MPFEFVSSTNLHNTWIGWIGIVLNWPNVFSTHKKKKQNKKLKSARPLHAFTLSDNIGCYYLYRLQYNACNAFQLSVDGLASGIKSSLIAHCKLHCIIQFVCSVYVFTWCVRVNLAKLKLQTVLYIRHYV